MALIYPGAVHRPTGDNGAMGRIPDVTSLHIAVTRAETSVFGWQQSAKACHGFTGKGGYFEQYVSFDRRVAGTLNGNGHVVTLESYDGLQPMSNPYREIGIGGIYGTSANTGRWDAGQCERTSDILAWQSLTYGLNLRVMNSSRPGETGVGPHRLGVDPWRVSGGEVWTAHPGKPCPGDLRIQQIPGIVARAIEIAAAVRKGRCGWLPPGLVNLAFALARTGSKPAEQQSEAGAEKPAPIPTPQPSEEDDMRSLLVRIVDSSDPNRTYSIRPGSVHHIPGPKAFKDGVRDGLYPSEDKIVDRYWGEVINLLRAADVPNPSQALNDAGFKGK